MSWLSEALSDTADFFTKDIWEGFGKGFRWKNVEEAIRDVGGFFSEDVPEAVKKSVIEPRVKLLTGKTNLSDILNIGATPLAGTATSLATGKTIGENLSELGGGGGGDDEDVITTNTTNTYDKETSELLKSIAGRQQLMAEEQWDLYKKEFLPYEIEVAKANRELIPYISDISKTILGLQGPITEKYYKESLGGVDVGKRMDEAQAEVINATKLGEGMRRREMSRLGISPNSTVYGNISNTANLETAKAIAGARTAAKNQAEAENYARLGSALGKGVFTTQVGANADPYARAAASYSGAAGSYSSLANRVLGTQTTQTVPGTGAAGTGQLLGGILGTAIGASYGGTQGAAAGYGIGSGIGGGIGSMF